MLRGARICCFVILGLAQRCVQADDWQLASSPALLPGDLGDWDDFLVATPCIVPSKQGWRMYYTGGQLDETGLTRAIGLATSADGVTWKKHETGSVLKGELGRGASPVPAGLELAGVCRGPDENLVMLLRERTAGNARQAFKFYRSADGLTWRAWPEAGAALARSIGSELILSCALDGDDTQAGRIHLWCLVDRSRPSERELWRMQWREPDAWSKPDTRSAGEIVADGELQSVGMASFSGYRLLYAAKQVPGPREPLRATFRVSGNLRLWQIQGPPDFAFPKDGREAAGESPRLGVLVGEEGTRLFYEWQDANGGVEIRAAFCPKSAYRSGS